MRTDKYYSVSTEVAKKAMLVDFRYRVEKDRFILSETDVRNMVARGVVSPTDVSSLDMREVSLKEAEVLIAKGKYKMGLKDNDNGKKDK